MPNREAPGRQPVTAVVTLAVKEDRVDEFLRLLLPILDAMRHEPTFINAVLHRDPEDPARFMVYETWADFDDLTKVQINRDYRKEYIDRLPDLLREPRGIQVWRPMRSDFAFLDSSSVNP